QAAVAVNGKRIEAAAGSFVRMEREWKSGDQIDLELPLKMRLEPVDPQHANTVAALSGPLVLFAIGESQPAVSRAQLMAVRKTGTQTWQVETGAGVLKMMPWTAV